jgi:membrane protein implicated in regulation of membrane protease activity
VRSILARRAGGDEFSYHPVGSTYMSWWLWIVLGLVLIAFELATPGGFFVIFFGIGALCVGALVLLGVVDAIWVQWLLFPLVALVTLRLFRQPMLGLMRIGQDGHEVDSLVGEVAIAAADIPPGQHGRAELRGSSWSARNVDTNTLAAGQRCRVVAVQGLMLDLRQE